MAIVGRWTRQSGDIIDYEIDFTDWFEDREDTPASFTVEVDDGVVINGSALDGLAVKFVSSGGIDGQRYHGTVALTTSIGVRKEADFIITIKDT